MKKALLFASIAVIFAACDGGGSVETVETEGMDTTSVETVEADSNPADSTVVVE